MTEPRGISPQELLDIYDEPLHQADAAVVSAREAVHFAAGSTAVGEADKDLEAAIYSRDSLRAAGRAALSTIDDFPPEDTLRAQMQIDGRADAERDAVFSHLAGLSAYAGTENALIATVEQAGQHSVLVRFLVPDAAEAESAVTLDRDGEKHDVVIRTASQYPFSINSQSYSVGRPSRQPEQYRTQSAFETALFADTPEAMPEALAKLALVANIDDPESRQSAVIYGDEAVGTFIRQLAERQQGLRPALFSAIQYFGRNYEVPALENKEARLRAEQEMTGMMQVYIVKVIGNYAHRPGQDPRSDAFLTPGMQEFLGITEDRLAQRVQDIIEGWSFADSDARVSCQAMESVAEAWKAVWDGLAERGFGPTADRMRVPAKVAYVAASIEHTALTRELNGTGAALIPTRRRLKRAVDAAAARLEALEQ